MKSVEVEIFGRRFRLRSDDPEETAAVASAINHDLNELRDLYEDLDFTKLLLLLTLKKQDEIVSLTKRVQQLEVDLQKVNQMLERIVGEI